MTTRSWGRIATTAVLISLFSLGASACDFYFSYDSISAPIGTVGDIGIQVHKTHAKCTLSSMDEYVIEGIGVQFLGETDWVDKGGGLYEKWIQVSLAEVGDGAVRISKTCTKEGYEEKVLPIAAQPAEAAEAVWVQAWNGTYPFEVSGDITSAVGAPVIEDRTLTVDGLTVTLAEGIVLPESLPDSVRLYALRTDNAISALLLVGDGLLIRFDHLLTS